MQKWQEVILTAALGATVPMVTAFFWLGRLDNRLETLEKSTVDLNANPIRAKCAELATSLASGRRYNPDEAAVPIGEPTPNVQEAMSALGCHNANNLSH